MLCLTANFQFSNDEWQFETQQKGTVSVWGERPLALPWPSTQRGQLLTDEQ